MKTATTSTIINVRIRYKSKTKIIKVVKLQLFTIENHTLHHLIGNTYKTINKNENIDILEELNISKPVPILLTKNSFKHIIKTRRKCLLPTKQRHH